MEIAVIGLPNSGKTTVFNALTRGSAQVAAFASVPGGPNVGVAKVPDRRLDVLTGLFHPRRTVMSEITYHDIPAAPEGLGKTQSISGLYLNLLQGADALLVVVRAFEDESVPYAGDGVDPMRDAEAMLYELAFADLEILERRLSRLDEGSKGAKASERDTITREKAFIERLKGGLESGTHLRDQSLVAEEARLLDGFQMLTAKPLIVMLNLGEDQAAERAPDLADLVNGRRSWRAAFCGKLEMELAQMEPADEREFRESLGLSESGLDLMLRMAREAADLITFFTGNANEVRAWPVPRGISAVKAAGKIHTDFERGFIRAEVVSFDDLERCATLVEARRQGVLRQEGKAYVVQDGDIMNILFNV